MRVLLGISASRPAVIDLLRPVGDIGIAVVHFKTVFGFLTRLAQLSKPPPCRITITQQLHAEEEI
jgi:hypothetical protein